MNKIKRLVLVSDSHGHNDTLDLIAMYEDDVCNYDITYVIAGDSEEDANSIKPFISVRGNMDYYPYPLDLTLSFYNHKVFVYHGHIHRIIPDDVSVICHGHSHVTKIDNNNGVYDLNPGSITYPRGNSERGYLEIDFFDDGNININYIKINDIIKYFNNKQG